MTEEGRTIAKRTANKKSNAEAKKKTAEQERFEKLTNSLTEELFEIAIGQPADGENGKGTASLSERLKAAELLAKYRKSSGEADSCAVPAVIIDDIE